MRDYYSEYVELCLQTCVGDDYSDSKRVRGHNRAMKKLVSLTSAMCDEPERSSLIWERLLNHTDQRVLLNASAECFKRSIHKDRAVSVLQQLSNCKDWSIAFSAGVILSHRR